jgi:uncharacterized repeat protein (TIGR02543 family)
VDCTWDDPTYDQFGLAQHTNFLVSDNKISQTSHSNWDAKIECDNTKYDNAYWQNVSSPICVTDNGTYYIDNTNGKIMKKVGSKTQTIKSSLGKWYTIDKTGYWNGTYSGLFIYNNRLYYNTYNQIKAISLDGADDQVIYTLKNSNNGHIYGIRFNNKAIQYTLKKSPDKTGTIQSLTNCFVIGVTSIKLNKTTLSLKKGNSETLTAKVYPDDASNKGVTWKSSNEKVVTVDQNGKVTAIGAGTATISVVTKSGNKTATCQVTVPYSISYILNGGLNNNTNPSLYDTTNTITLKNATRKGYIFSGWYSDEQFKNKVTTIKKGDKGNKTLYAKWTKVAVSKINKVSLKNIKENKLKITFSEISDAKGYEIQYSTNKGMTSVITKTVTDESATYSLIKGKTYYARVRAYKLDSTGSKVYGDWSTLKNIKITK